MPHEREHSSKRIKTVDYDIADNQIRAWYNAAGDLIFVLDETIDEDKPNVLLVIDSFDERKWDDVLSNDYGIDLETVRPKKDNKYQKLDIEYGGLDVYAELIDAYESDDDLDGALENLMRFRAMSVRRNAKERLAAAEETISKSHDTIERTNDAISELRARIKTLRSKLAEQKRNVGREPTKVSAAKILKTESQIDATDEKLARAKKRLESAKRRLAAAEDDAEIARAILARRVDVKPVRRSKPIRVVKPTPVVRRRDFDDDEEETSENDEYSEEYEDTETYEPKVTDADDTDEEVKPLFDTDPNVLDENIAFKPIDFNATESFDTGHDSGATQTTEFAPAPLSFTPPTETYGAETVEEETPVETTPMLDNLNYVTDENVTEEPSVPSEEIVAESKPVEIFEQVEEPVLPSQTMQPESVDQVAPAEPVVAPIPSEPIEPVAPITAARPVSPISGYVEVNQTTKKSGGVIYYLLLILLICLSIFTLWIYQKKTGGNMPDLAATIGLSDKSDKTDAESQKTFDGTTAFVDVEKAEPVVAETVAVTEEEKPVEQPVAVDVLPEPVPVAEAEPAKPVESEPVAVPVETPFVELRTIANYEPEKKPIPTEEEVLARKPGYNVSQNEKMFVAAPEYNTESVVAETATESLDATYSLDTDVQPTLVPEIVASEVVSAEPVASEDEEVETCAGGVPADEYGCCPGEEYSYTDDGFMCCTDDGCLPPL